MGMGKQANGQLDPDTYEALLEIAKGQNLKTSTLVGKIITDFVQIHHYKFQRGDIPLSKPVIRKIFGAIDPKRIQEIIDFNSDFILSEIRVQEGIPTYEVFLKHLMRWNEGRFQFNVIHQPGSDLIVSKHSLCKTWSEIQCKIYARCFEMTGQTVLELDYGSEDYFSIEVARYS